jgi:hypothetical protein
MGSIAIPWDMLPRRPDPRRQFCSWIGCVLRPFACDCPRGPCPRFHSREQKVRQEDGPGEDALYTDIGDPFNLQGSGTIRMNGTGQGFACLLSKFLFLYPGSRFTSPCPNETGNLPSVRESPTCPLGRDGCFLLSPSAPGDAAALTPGLPLLLTSLESAHCLSIFWCTPCFLFGQLTWRGSIYSTPHRFF